MNLHPLLVYIPFPSQGLPFCLRPEKMGVYSLRKDILEYVIRLRVTAEGVFYTDEKIDHDFWMCRRL